MKKLQPYKTVRGAVAAFDNGGRFFNLFTEAADGTITSAELGKAAGTLGALPHTLLYFEMMIAWLPETEQESVISKLDPSLRRKFRAKRAIRLAEADRSTLPKKPPAVIVTGKPEYARSRTQFTGFITIPVQTGSVSSSIQIPIHDEFALYTMKGGGIDDVPVAVSKSVGKLPAAQVIVGGYLMKMSAEEGDNPRETKAYISAQYYCLATPSA